MIDQGLLIETFVQGIATKEGYYASKSIATIPQRLNNPCDLRSWKDPKGRAYLELNGYAVFPSCKKEGCTHPDHPSEIGFAAGRGQCRINIIKRKLSFYEFFAGKAKVYGGFCPRGDGGKNDPIGYANFLLTHVVKKLGLDANKVSINTPIASLIEVIK